MISNEVFVSFLNCRRKAFFKQAGQLGEVADIERVQVRVGKIHSRVALDRFLGQTEEGDVLHDPPSLARAIQSRVRFIVGSIAQSDDLSPRIDLLERLDDGGGAASVYAPILFVRANKVAKSDRLLLAFQALALSQVQGTLADTGKIVSGSECRVIRVRLAPLVEEARQVVSLIKGGQEKNAPPALTLNRHCAACEYRKGCQAVAEQADDLSLLRSLSEKDVQNQRSRGVTTLTQFSHTYRPGRRGKRRLEKARKHDPALQALALREKKVYVMDEPPLKEAPVAIYLDVEGVPDRDFYYLIGAADR